MKYSWLRTLVVFLVCAGPANARDDGARREVASAQHQREFVQMWGVEAADSDLAGQTFKAFHFEHGQLLTHEGVAVRIVIDTADTVARVRTLEIRKDGPQFAPVGDDPSGQPRFLGALPLDSTGAAEGLRFGLWRDHESSQTVVGRYRGDGSTDVEVTYALDFEASVISSIHPLHGGSLFIALATNPDEHGRFRVVMYRTSRLVDRPEN